MKRATFIHQILAITDIQPTVDQTLALTDLYDSLYSSTGNKPMNTFSQKDKDYLILKRKTIAHKKLANQLGVSTTQIRSFYSNLKSHA